MTEEKQRGNLRATLALSQDEARTGTERTITLPDGRKVSLFIYPGAYSGQKIHLAGRGELTTDGTIGDLIITLSVPSADSFATYPFVSNASDAKMNSIYPTSSPHSPAYQSAMRPPYTPPVPSSQPFNSHQSYDTPTPPSRIFPQQQPFLSMQRSSLMTAATLNSCSHVADRWKPCPVYYCLCTP